MSTRRLSFGPTALVTPANGVTLARLLATPAVIALVLRTGPSSVLLSVLWVAVAGSDGLDGLVARRHGATRSGAFLDPLADKFLVLGALGSLAAIGEVSWWPVAVIAAREVAMSAYRSYAARRGVSVPARPAAKLKTLLQDAAVLAALLPLTGHHRGFVATMLWIAVALTVWTGLEYLHDGRRLLGRAVPVETVEDSPAH